MNDSNPKRSSGAPRLADIPRWTAPLESPRLPWVAGFLAMLLCLGCDDLRERLEKIEYVSGNEAHLVLRIRPASDPDPLEGNQPIGSFAIHLRSEDNPTREAYLAYHSDSDQVTGTELEFRPTERARATVWGMDIDNRPVCVGRSGIFTIPENPQTPIDVSVFLGLPDSWSRPSEDHLWQRVEGAAVGLGDGRVLMVGGRVDDVFQPPVIYDHRSGTLEPLDGGPRASWPAAVGLGDGRAVVAGGLSADAVSREVWLFDGDEMVRITGDFHPRWGAMAIFLAEARKAVFAGGFDTSEPGGPATDIVSVLDFSTEPPIIFDGVTRLPVPRALASVTPLMDYIDPESGAPAALIAGGLEQEGGSALATALVLTAGPNGALILADTQAGPIGSSATATMNSGRLDHVAVPLPGGNVLLLGGSDGQELLEEPDPVIFSPLVSNPGGFVSITLEGAPSTARAARAGGLGAPLPDGSALVVGGVIEGAASRQAFRFRIRAGQDPVTSSTLEGRWDPVELDSSPRLGGHAVALPGNEVLVLGGMEPSGDGQNVASSKAEIFVPCADQDRPCEL